MITRVKFTNFKSLRDVEIGLERFTMFVGPNASGKSSVLQGLDLLCRAFRAEMIDEELRSATSSGATANAALAAECAGKVFRYTGVDPKKVFDPQVNWNGDGHAVADDGDCDVWHPWRPAAGVPSPLAHSFLPCFERSKLVSAHATLDPANVAADGSGLHSALANMALNDPDSWQELQQRLRSLIPPLLRLRFTPASGGQPPALLFDTNGAVGLPAAQVSEGALTLLALLATIYGRARPKLLLLDGLDRGLHPLVQRDLVGLLRQRLAADPALQIVGVTNSTYLLNVVEPEEVRVLHPDEFGATVCAPLAEHPKFERWKDEFHSGEMWSVFGERWLAEPVAVP